MAALRKLHAKGATITKADPNAVKRKRASGSDIAARVEKNQSSSEGRCDCSAANQNPWWLCVAVWDPIRRLLSILLLRNRDMNHLLIVLVLIQKTFVKKECFT